MKIVAEEYTPLGHTDYATTVNKIKQRQARTWSSTR